MSETILASKLPRILDILGSTTPGLLPLALCASMQASAEQDISVPAHFEEGISVPGRIGSDISVTADAAWVQVLYFP